MEIVYLKLLFVLYLIFCDVNYFVMNWGSLLIKSILMNFENAVKRVISIWYIMVLKCVCGWQGVRYYDYIHIKTTEVCVMYTPKCRASSVGIALGFLS